MLDLHLIRQQPEHVREALRRRQHDPGIVDQILEADEVRRTTLSELEARRNQRNVGAKELGRMPDDALRQARRTEMGTINARIKVLEGEVGEVEARLNNLLVQLPNIPDPDVPYGKDDSENVVL